MFNFLIRARVLWVLLPLALLATANSYAEPMTFSYTFVGRPTQPFSAGAVLTGTIDGTIDPMSPDKVFVNSFGPVRFIRPGLPVFNYASIDSTEFNTIPSGGMTLMSFSGLFLDFRSCPLGFTNSSVPPFTTPPFDDCPFAFAPGGGFGISYNVAAAFGGFASAADGTGNTLLCSDVEPDGPRGIAGCRATDVPIHAENWSLVRLDPDADGVLGDDDFCPGTEIPEGVPTRSLGVNRFALVDDDDVFDTTSPNGMGPQRNYTIADTAGCSCTQIIDAQGLGKAHTKFGCSISAMDDWVELVCPARNSAYRIEETDITLIGSWTSEGGFPEYSGGTSVYANFDVFDPNASAHFEFVGTGITWIGLRSFNAGLFEWVIDEGTAEEIGGTVNTYIDGVDRSTTEVLATNLSCGIHTFTYRSLGIHGLTMTPGVPSETYIDAFDVTP